jgi:hypothetical protein
LSPFLGFSINTHAGENNPEIKTQELGEQVMKSNQYEALPEATRKEAKEVAAFLTECLGSAKRAKTRGIIELALSNLRNFYPVRKRLTITAAQRASILTHAVKSGINIPAVFDEKVGIYDRQTGETYLVGSMGDPTNFEESDYSTPDPQERRGKLSYEDVPLDIAPSAKGHIEFIPDANDTLETIAENLVYMGRFVEMEIPAYRKLLEAIALQNEQILIRLDKGGE